MILNFVLSNIICFGLRYYSYKNYLNIFFGQKTRRKWIKGAGLLLYYILASYIPNFGVLGNFVVEVIVNSIYGNWLYEGAVAIKLPYITLFSFLSAACEYIVASIMQFVNDNRGITEPYFIFGMLLSWCLLLFVVMFLKRILNPQKHKALNRQYWFMLILLSLSTFLVNASVFVLYTHSTQVSDGYYAILVALLMILITISIFKIYEHLADRAELEMKTAVYEQQAVIYRNQISEQEHTMQEFRRLCHDMKNHLIYVEELLTQNERDAAVRYIQGLLSCEGLSPLGLSRSGNSVVDGMINYKAAYIKDKGITVSALHQWNGRRKNAAVLYRLRNRTPYLRLQY